MDRTRFLIQAFDKRTLLVFCTVLFSLTWTSALGSNLTAPDTDNLNKRKVIRQVAKEWIQAGTRQHKRGFYEQAERSFLQALQYELYLTVVERAELDQLLEKAHEAALGRKGLQEHIKVTNKLVEQQQLLKAKAHLNQLKTSQFLSDEGREQIAEQITQIDKQLGEHRRETAALYSRSVEFYRTGEFERARSGFIEVAQSGLLSAPSGKTAEDYLTKIDRLLPLDARLLSQSETKAEKVVEETFSDEQENQLFAAHTEALQKTDSNLLEVPNEPAVITINDTKIKQETYIEAVSRKRKILQSYARAVVENAVVKAQNYLSESKFYQATQAVKKAQSLLDKEKLNLGDELFNHYSSQLEQIVEQTRKGRTKWLGK